MLNKNLRRNSFGTVTYEGEQTTLTREEEAHLGEFIRDSRGLKWDGKSKKQVRNVPAFLA